MRFWRLFVIPLLLVGLATLVQRVAVKAASVDDFIDFSSDPLPGRLYVPSEAEDPAAPRPFILFLHGAGETGSDNVSQVNGNIDNLLNAARQRGAFLYAPQATTFNWTDSGRTTNVMTMIDQALAEQNADPSRLYVTGLSMGGGGTWNMLNRFSEQFAAGVPIAAVNPSGDFDPARLVDKPTWAFHARDDSVVSKNSSRNTINRILSVANEPTLDFPPDNDSNTFEYLNETLELNYTEWPTGGHGIWGRVYNTTEMYDWMFSQSLSGSTFETISLSGLGQTYVQDFDDALGADGTVVGVAFPTAWTHGRWGTETTTSFPVEENFGSSATFNSGAENDSDRALAIGVSGSNDEHFLQMLADVTEGGAGSFRLQFDIEAWDARDGTFVEPLNRFVNRPDDPGEAAFHVTVDVDTGDGFSPLVDLGTVTTGPMLQPMFEGIVDGNADANRVSFDSGVVTASIPQGANLRLRWAAATAAETAGWVFGLDNVALSLFGDRGEEGDFNGDGVVNVTDLDDLTAEVLAGTNDPLFDLDSNGTVDVDDRTVWITDIKDTFVGDANLDGQVNAQDLNALALSWQRMSATSWSQGDFNGDRNVDAADLNELALNWLNDSASAAPLPAVPEPSSIMLLFGVVLLGLIHRR